MATDSVPLTRQFSVETRVVAGIGAIHELAGSLAECGAARVAVVADRGVADVGLLERVISSRVPVFGPVWRT